MSNGYYPDGDTYRRVDDNLVYSILVTIFCCMPFGVPAIVYSAMAQGKNESGDYQGAQRDATHAKNWCLAAFITGLLTLGIFALVNCGG